MTKKQLLEKALEIQKENPKDREICHIEMDALLLKYLNMPEIDKIYEDSGFWYA